MLGKVRKAAWNIGRRRWVPALALVTALAGLGVAAYALFSSPGEVLSLVRNTNVETFRETIRSFGVWAPLASIGLMLLHTFVVFPFELLALANGLVFGAWGGIAITWFSMMLSAWLGYAVARYSSPLVFRLVPGDRLKQAEAWVARRSGWQLAALRLVPVISFSLLNLVLGLLHVRLWRFTWTTAIGIVPIVVASVLFGHLLTLGVWGWVVASVAAAAAFGAYYLLRSRTKPGKARKAKKPSTKRR